MTAFSVSANVYSDEGLCDGITTVTFPWTSRKVIVMNDEATRDMMVTLKQGTEIDLTLKAGEQLTLYHRAKTMELSSVSGSVNYRVWAFG